MIRSAAVVIGAALGASAVGWSALGQCHVGDIYPPNFPNHEDNGFGLPLAVTADWLVVSATLDDEAGMDNGAVYVYGRSSEGVWELSTKLMPREGASTDQMFGWRLSAQEDSVFVRALHGDGLGRPTIDVFRYDGENWLNHRILPPTDSGPIRFFGESLDVSGDTLVVGMPNSKHGGSAFVYEQVDGKWTLVQRLDSPDPDSDRGFGTSVAVDTDTIAISDPEYGNSEGAAYIYERDGDKWIYTATLEMGELPWEGYAAWRFGYGLDVHDGIVAVTAEAFRWGVGGGTEFLPIGLYQKNGTNWTREHVLRVFGVSWYGNFGARITLTDDALYSNSEWTYSGTQEGAGAITCFRRNGASWTSPILYRTQLPHSYEFLSHHAVYGNVLFGSRDVWYDKGEQPYNIVTEFRTDCTSSQISSYEAVVGTEVTGNNWYLIDGPNDEFALIDSGFGSTLTDLHNMTLQVDAAAPVTSASTMFMRVHMHIDEPVGTAQFQLRNWNNGQFEVVSQQPIGDEMQVYLLEDIPAANYVNTSGGGEIELRLKHIVHVPFLAYQFRSTVDYVLMEID